MKNTNKKGFTIVELVIVIAVIAILSAVLIPTFGAIIKDANVAADKATANMLTTELHTYLKGETIDSEAELVEALEKSGVGTKLVPKSLAHGYHYWFNMATKSFEVKTSAEVEGIELAIANVERNAVLINETNAPTPVSANKGLREVYDNGYFFVDESGSSYSAYAIAFIDTIKNASEYEMVVEDFLGMAIDNDADTKLANDIKNKILSITIHTESGVYFCNNASTGVYVSAKAKYLSGNYYNYNTSTGLAEKVEGNKAIAPIPAVGEGNLPVINIPSNITYITDHAFDFDLKSYETYATSVYVGISSTVAAANMLSPASTNAYIQLGDQNVVHAIAKVTENGRQIDVLKAIDTFTYGRENEYTIALSGNLPFADFVIGTPDNTNVSIREEDGNRKIYVTSKNGTLQLYAVNANDPTQTSNRVSNWTVIEGTTGSLAIDEKTGIVDLSKAVAVDYTIGDKTIKVCEVQIKGTATTDEGTASSTVTVVVAMPVSASIKINPNPKDNTIQQTLYHNVTNEIELGYTGDLFAYEVSDLDGVQYSRDILDRDAYQLAVGDSSAVPTASLSVSKKNPDGTDTIFVYDSTKKQVVINSPDVEDGEYQLTLLVDNCLPINVNVTTINLEAVLVDTLYRHNSTVARPFYIGSGNTITLSDIFKATDYFLEVEGAEDITATLNIYDAVGASGKLSELYMANKSPGLLSTKITTPDGTADLDSISINAEALATTSIEFIFANNFRGTTNDIYIQIIPDDEMLESLVLKFTVVKNAINVFNRDITGDVNDAKFIDDLFKAGKDVVLYTDLVAATGDHINIGDHTLYGNGFVIDANEYVTTTTELSFTWCKKCSKVAEGNCLKSPSVGNLWQGHKSETETRYYYNTDKSLIAIANGTIDNIYINGPVYPTLQYYSVDYTKDNVGYAVTPYYVSGITTTGNATISNSYVSGFRQPISVAGDNLNGEFKDGKVVITTEAEVTTIINTTVEGGNYANVVLVSGHLSLTDVTTIQKVEGYTPTVGYAETDTFKVIGLGIAIEDTTMVAHGSELYNAADAAANEYATVIDAKIVADANKKVETYKKEQIELNGEENNDNISEENLQAQYESYYNEIKTNEIDKKRTELLQTLNPVIEINGYMDQHNWVKHGDNSIKMPKLDSLDSRTLFGYIFDGVEMNIDIILLLLNIRICTDIDLGEVKYYIHQDNAGTPGNYINAGIVIAEIGEAAEKLPISASIVVDNRDSEGSTDKRTMVPMDLTFSKTGIEKAGIKVTADQMIGTKGIFMAWSYYDGRTWAPEAVGLNELEKTGDERYFTKKYELSRRYNVSSTTNQIKLDNDDLVYSGYYVDYCTVEAE